MVLNEERNYSKVVISLTNWIPVSFEELSAQRIEILHVTFLNV